MEIKQESDLNFEVTPRTHEVVDSVAEARASVASSFSEIGQLATKPDTYQVPVSEQPVAGREVLSPVEEIIRIGSNLKAMRANKAA